MNSNELFTVSGLVAVVTGGTGVLGGAMCKALAANGAKVAVLGRSQEKADAILSDIAAAGGEAAFYKTDIFDRESLQNVANDIAESFGPIDVLVNCAGGNKAGATSTPENPFWNLPADDLEGVMKLNIVGTMVPSQVFGKAIADNPKGGTIVNISSMAASQPLTKVVGYSASKAAIDNFTRWMSVFMNQNYGDKVRVNAIAPGFFLTEQNRFLLTDKETGDLTPRGATIISQTPMGRFGDPEELIGALLYLVSPAGKFVTGIVLPVDGGFSAFSGV